MFSLKNKLGVNISYSSKNFNWPLFSRLSSIEITRKSKFPPADEIFFRTKKIKRNLRKYSLMTKLCTVFIVS